MQLLAAFSTLMLAVQLVAAVHSDLLQQPRFVKIKRGISTNAGDLERPHGLQRRGGTTDALFSGVKELTAKYEQMGGHSEPQKKALEDLRNLVKTHEAASTTHYVHPNPQPGTAHYINPEGQPTSIGEHFNLAPHPPGPARDPQAWLAEHERWLAQHQQLLDEHRAGLYAQKDSMENGLANIEQHGLMLDQHRQTLDAHAAALSRQEAAIKQSLYDGTVHKEEIDTLKATQNSLVENQGQVQNQEQNRQASSRYSKWLLYGGLGLATASAVGTSMATQRMTSNHLSDMADEIQAQQNEIRRLKGLSGQQGIMMPGQGAAMANGQGGVMANGRGASDGGLV